VNYCHECGYKLARGTEKHCPNCGLNLIHNKGKNNDGSTLITDTSGAVIGTGLTGNDNIIGKDIDYTVQGNVINLHFLGDVSNEVLEKFQKILLTSVQLEPISSPNNNIDKENYELTPEEFTTAQNQIHSLLKETQKIENKTGTKIQGIRVGDLQISKNELTWKEIMLKGNECFYNKEYDKAIECYDNALKINPSYALAWYNKGLTFFELKKYNEAIECYDNALKINPSYALALNNKGTVFDRLKKYNEAIECYDNALKINPSYALAWRNKGAVLCNLGRHSEMANCYAEAARLDPNIFKGTASNVLQSL
jgi:tetratricopeptide (TPR) repeat protein